MCIYNIYTKKKFSGTGEGVECTLCSRGEGVECTLRGRVELSGMRSA